MNDIVTRLRDWRNVHLARLHLLMDEAADEIERLRADWPEQLTAHKVLITEQELEIGRLRLTDEEREAVEWRRKGIIVYSAGTVVATIATAVLFLSLLWFAK